MKERDLRFWIVGLGKMGILHFCILNVLPKVESASARRTGKNIYEIIGNLVGS